MKRGEIYRTSEKVPERGYKPGFYVVVSHNFIAENEDVSTVVCAPAYSEMLGLRSEVVLGISENYLPALDGLSLLLVAVRNRKRGNRKQILATRH